MRDQRDAKDDWQIRQGTPEEWEIEDIEKGKPRGDGPGPVLDPDSVEPDPHELPGTAE